MILQGLTKNKYSNLRLSAKEWWLKEHSEVLEENKGAGKESADSIAVDKSSKKQIG